MTTILYKKWEYLAWDKRFTWGICSVWITEDKIMEYIIEKKNVDDNGYPIFITKKPYINKVIIWYAGNHLLTNLKRNILTKVFSNLKLWELEDKLYEFQKELLKYSDDFGIILIIIYDWKEYAYHICDKYIEDIQDNYAAMWTGSVYAEWIMLLDNNCPIWKIFELVSSKDIKTSADYNIIKL